MVGMLLNVVTIRQRCGSGVPLPNRATPMCNSFSGPCTKKVGVSRRIMRLWFQKAADQGNAAAQFELGRMYASGHGVPEDEAEAANWVRKAADHGYANAQMMLGTMYGTGHGVPQDHAAAMKWYRKAAHQGNAGAQSLLGTAYYKGRGVAMSTGSRHERCDLICRRCFSRPIS